MRWYRRALAFSVLAIIALGAALVYEMRAHSPAATAPSFSPVVASGPPLRPGAAPSRDGLILGGGAAAPSNPKLEPVQISPLTLQSIGVEVGKVRYGPVASIVRTVGNVVPDQRLLAAVQVRFSGWVEREYANQIYQFIRRGQPLLTIYSPEVVTSEQDYLLARQNRDLLDSSTVSGVAVGANTLLAASRQRLEQWQVPAREIARLERTGKVLQTITLDSPVTGYVFQRNVLPNQFVQAGTTLYTVANLSKVWVNAQVFQADAAQLRLGEPATVTVDAYPGRVFHGRVDHIDPVVETATRTVPVRLVFSNPGLKLMPGMFVNAEIHVALGRQLTIPANAVLQTGTRDVVFVDQGGGYLAPRFVQLGPEAGQRFVVRRGLRAGQRIVTSANFLIDSESQLQAALGGYMPPPPGVSANARQPAQVRARLTLATQPSPPAKGRNRLTARLIGAGGQGIAGAAVTVHFFMPAMPAMGMAAQHAAATLADRGGGNYAGVIQLPSGGTWQVAVTARRNGQVIVSRQLHLGGGGM